MLLELLSHQGCHHEPGLDQPQDALPMCWCVFVTTRLLWRDARLPVVGQIGAFPLIKLLGPLVCPGLLRC